MIIYTKIRISTDYKVFILLNVHPAKKYGSAATRFSAVTSRGESIASPEEREKAILAHIHQLGQELMAANI